MQKRRKLIAISLAVVTLAAAGVYALQHRQSDSASPFTIAQVERGDITQSVATTGTLSPLISVEVSSQISGLITDVNVDFNTVVKKGQILARIDSATYVQKLEQAQANLAAAQAVHALNTLNAARLKGLRDNDLVSQQDFDQVQAVLEQSQANLLTQKAVVKNAQTDLERCTITSPIDGIVIFKQADVGKTVVSSFSAPTLFTIAQDMTKMRILASISEVDVWSVRPGQEVSFTVDALPGKTFYGKLTQIRDPYTPSDRQLQQQAQVTIASFDAIIDVDNKDLLLRPSLTAMVSIITAKREKALKVPSGAVNVRLPEGVKPVPVIQVAATSTEHEGVVPSERHAATVYRISGANRGELPLAIGVVTGINDGVFTEILSGVNEGDTLITGTASAFEPEKRSLFR